MKEIVKVNFDNVDEVIHSYYSEIAKIAEPKILRFITEESIWPTEILVSFPEIEEND